MHTPLAGPQASAATGLVHVMFQSTLQAAYGRHSCPAGNQTALGMKSACLDAPAVASRQVHTAEQLDMQEP